MTELLGDLNPRQRRWLTAFLVTGTLAFALVVVGYLATYWNFFGDVIFTFFLAWLLAYILTPPVTFLLRHIPRLPRIVAVVFVYALLTLALVALIVVVADALLKSVNDFINNAPQLRAQLPEMLRPLEDRLKALGFGQVDFTAQANSFLDSFASTAGQLVGPLQQVALASLSVLSNFLIVFFLSVFIVIDRDRMMSFSLRLVPPRYADEARLFETSVSRSFGGFLRGQAVIGLLYAAVALFTSLILGLSYLPLTTALSGALMAIPFFGPFVSWIPPVMVAILEKPDVIVPALALMGGGWFVVMNIIQPRVLANAVGIPPIVVFAAVLIGAKVAGIAGAIFGLPVAAVISSIVMYSLRRQGVAETGTVAARAARRLGAREGRPLRVPREPLPGEAEDLEEAARGRPIAAVTARTPAGGEPVRMARPMTAAAAEPDLAPSAAVLAGPVDAIAPVDALEPGTAAAAAAEPSSDLGAAMDEGFPAAAEAPSVSDAPAGPAVAPADPPEMPPVAAAEPPEAPAAPASDGAPSPEPAP